MAANAYILSSNIVLLIKDNVSESFGFCFIAPDQLFIRDFMKNYPRCRIICAENHVYGKADLGVPKFAVFSSNL